MRHFAPLCGLIFVLLVGSLAQARDLEMGGDDQFPYSIMAPEPGTHSHHRSVALPPRRSPHASLLGHEKFVAKLHRGPKMFATRGSSGSVLPTPLPRTQLIPPEGGGRLIVPALPHDQGLTFVPGSTTGVPNMPHGSETFQDRASRCAHQAGAYGVPGNTTTQYMGACAM